MRDLKVGDKIKLTGQFLRNTGQHTGPGGLSTWVVQACDCDLCKTGRFVATNGDSYFTDGKRHFAKGNVYKVGTLDARNA